MAIPSGSGTEVLKRAYIAAMTNSPQKIIDGVANHIYTVLNVTFCEQANDVELLHMFIYPAANSGAPIYLIGSTGIGKYETFVYNDKIILTGTDELLVQTSAGANIDVYCNYIDQDWT